MSRAREILQHVFGYTCFRGQQEAVVEHLVAGGDALVLMPTGGGKSLCFQIPALLRPGTAIVVSPLIALMHDQVSALREAGVAAAYLNSSQGQEEAWATEMDLREGRLDLLYVAPERLLAGRTLAMLEALHRDRAIALFAIDEAHCVAQWGHDFRPEYLQLSVLAERFPGVPRIALTATADARGREEIAERLVLGDARRFVSSFDRPNIRYRIADKDSPRQQLLAFIRDEHKGEAGIVYCLSRRKVDETAAFLADQGIAALPYHAGMTTELRSANQLRFLHEEATVMVATIAFGMGIDKPDVRFVAHLDLPRSIEGYYQETGRAGRDGLPAEALLLWGAGDVVQQRRMIDMSEGSEPFKRQARSRLDTLVALAETTGCRRQMLLAHFGEASEPCGNCDTCLAPPQTWDATEAARKALSCVYRTGQRYGAGHLVDVLRGEASDKVVERGHDRVSTFGIGADVDEKTWKSLFRQLIARGLLAVDHERFNALVLTETSRPLLRGETALQLRIPTARRKPRREPRIVGRDARHDALYEKLRAWRAETARERNVPAYVIFHDATLLEIAQQRPASLDQLSQISGVGDRKLEAYGGPLLALVSDEAAA
ncbi:MAG: DNA helicase RecQ [Rhodocyclaceae bacterium]|nr:DNA helicase RecQ [Rhodocyclaceae bacterium]